MTAVLKVAIRVIRDRVVARVGDVDVVVGLLVRCPCCGEPVDFRRAACPT